jgi:hypothetical protein
VIGNAATGGMQLFSPRATAAPNLRVWPVPGQAWQLSEVAAGALPALNDTGIYTPLAGEEADESLPGMVLGRQGDGYFFGGAIGRGRNAHPYPAAEIAAVVERHPAVHHAAGIVAAGRWMNDARLVVLAFVDDTRGQDGRFAPPVTIPELRALIEREMGERFTPDRIDVLPLRPRIVDGAVDLGWCRTQYLGGALTAKARSEVFVLLSRLGYILAGTPAEK